MQPSQRDVGHKKTNHDAGFLFLNVAGRRGNLLKKCFFRVSNNVSSNQLLSWPIYSFTV